VAVIEGGQQSRPARQQHAVAEHIAGHIADAHHGVRIALRIDAEVGEVVLHAFPRAAGGDAVLLVVVALGPARGERVAQPEVARHRNLVGRVREVGGALVGRHHEVRIVAIEPVHPHRRDRVAVRIQVVGHVEEARHEDPILLVRQGTRLAGRESGSPQDEATLGADGHDQPVLQHLGHHQPEDLDAQVVRAVAPAQAPARHRPAPQVDAQELGRVHHDLPVGHHARELLDLTRGQLEDDAVGRGRRREEVGPDGRLDEIAETGERAVLVQGGDPIAIRLEAGAQLLLVVAAPGLRARGVVAHLEVPDQEAHGQRVLEHHLAQEWPRQRPLDLHEVLDVCAQQIDLAPVETGAEHEPIQGVARDVPEERGRQGLGQAGRDGIQIFLTRAERQDAQRLHRRRRAVARLYLGQLRVDHADPEMVGYLDDVRQQRRLLQVDAQCRGGPLPVRVDEVERELG
jgi:hypothetical protein